MHKTPLFLLILKTVIGIAMCFFLGMLYWSSLIIEEKCLLIEDGLKIIQKDLAQMGQTFQVHKRVYQKSGVSQEKGDYEGHLIHSLNPTLDEKTNLLKNDPYFTQILPRIREGNSQSYGILRLATIGHPDTLHPFSNWKESSSWNSQCQGSIASQQFGVYETMVKDLAISMEEIPSTHTHEVTFLIKLRDDIYWQPLERRFFTEDFELADHFLHKQRVTAKDFKFCYDAVMNPHIDAMGAVQMRNQYKDIISFVVIDDTTFSITWAKHKVELPHTNTEQYQLLYRAKYLTGSMTPLPSFVFKYFANGKKICEQDQEVDFYRKSSVWANNFQHHFASQIIVSCGPWIFDGMTDQGIHFRRNPDYYSPWYALYERMEVRFFNSIDAIWRAFQSGDIDACSLSPQELVELEDFLQSDFYRQQAQSGRKINRLDYVYRAFTWVAWNQQNPLFKSDKIRRALTYAIDRERLIRQNLNGQGVEISGPFFVGWDSNDPSIRPWPYDPEEAKRILLEEGWSESESGDGVLEKQIEGRQVPFRFYLTYYSKNPVTRANCELIALCLRNIGIDCILKGVEMADLSAACDDRSFDALYLSWGFPAPPEDPEALWHSKGVYTKGSLNFTGFSNPQVDRLIEELKYESNKQVRQKLFHQIHQILHEEQPYLFLYTPKVTLVYWNYLENIFIPKAHPEVIPGANVEEPNLLIGWINKELASS